MTEEVQLRINDNKGAFYIEIEGKQEAKVANCLLMDCLLDEAPNAMIFFIFFIYLTSFPLVFVILIIKQKPSKELKFLS